MNRPQLLRYILFALSVYGIWVILYFGTAWIGAARGPAFDPSLGIDASIPFIPAFQYAYALCYVMPLGLFFIELEAAFLNRAFAAFIAANVFAFLFFALFPVAGPLRETAAQGGASQNFFIDLIYSIDSRYNALPSLHVANPWLVALLSIERRGWTGRSVLFLSAAVLISVATLFVRQHYILDVAAGVLLAGGTILLFRVVWKRNSEKREE